MEVDSLPASGQPQSESCCQAAGCYRNEGCSGSSANNVRWKRSLLYDVFQPLSRLEELVMRNKRGTPFDLERLDGGASTFAMRYAGASRRSAGVAARFRDG